MGCRNLLFMTSDTDILFAFCIEWSSVFGICCICRVSSVFWTRCVDSLLSNMCPDDGLLNKSLTLLLDTCIRLYLYIFSIKVPLFSHKASTFSHRLYTNSLCNTMQPYRANSFQCTVQYLNIVKDVANQ